MRRYFRLRDDMTVPGRWHLGEVHTESGYEPLLDAGILFPGSAALFAEVTNAGRTLDFCLTSFAVPVATRQLGDAIAAVAGPDVQILPVGIGGQPAMVVLNATRVVRCLDETSSEFLKWTTKDHRADLAGQYRQVTKLVVDPHAIPFDAHFFRIEGWLVALIVSEAVRHTMERVGCVGAAFAEVT